MAPEVTTKLIDELRDEALRDLNGLNTMEALESWRVSYLGRRGSLTTILRGIGGLSPEHRHAVGSLANQTKALLDERFGQKVQAVKESGTVRLAEEQRIDVTLPGRPVTTGRLHPTTQIVRRYVTPSSPWVFRSWRAPRWSGTGTTSRY